MIRGCAYGERWRISSDVSIVRCVRIKGGGWSGYTSATFGALVDP